MTTDIRFDGVHHSAALYAFAQGLVDARLRRFGSPLTRVVIRIADVNGPRGGPDKRCRITLLGPGIGTATAQSLDADAYEAVRTCVGRAAHVLGRRVARRRVTAARSSAAPGSSAPRGTRTGEPS